MLIQGKVGGITPYWPLGRIAVAQGLIDRSTHTLRTVPWIPLPWQVGAGRLFGHGEMISAR